MYLKINNLECKGEPMLIQTYKATIKNLLRSISFWLAFTVLAIISVQGAIDGFYIGDNDPEIVLTQNDYIQCVLNSAVSKLLMFAMPIFTVIAVVMVLNRDYGDHYFEIEKAAGIKTSNYLLGRILALLTIVFTSMVFMHFLCLHLYIFTRGGVAGMTLGEYLQDSFVRVLRADIFVALPNIMFYIGLSFCMGTILKSGIASAVISLSHVLLYYASYLFFRLFYGELYFDYFSPIPRKLQMYFHYYDTEWFEDTLSYFDTSLFDAVCCILFLVSFSSICYLISYLRIRKRTV